MSSNQMQNITKAVPQPSFTPVQTGLLQRKCACGQHTIAGGECAGCRQKREGKMQRAAVSAASVNSVPPIVHDVLSSSGQSLDAGTRAFMEPRFGHDFSQVRVHTDARAAESTRAVNALAYTVGRDVVFATEQYQPTTNVGKRLLAHELAHTIQQSSSSAAKLAAKTDGISLLSSQEAEIEADEVAQNIAAGQREVGISAHQSSPALQRQVHSSPAMSVRSPVAEEFITQESDIQAGLAGRPLLSSEIALARPIFGNAINYSKVRLIPTSIAEFTTVGNNIRVSKDFTISEPLFAEILIHELTHVWQYQHGGTSYISVSLAAQIAASIKTPSRNFAYDYQITPDKSFFSFLPEQQGLIVQNYFAMLRDKAEPRGPHLYRANHLDLAACAKYLDCFPRLSWQARQAEIARELPLHEPLIKQMQAAFPKSEADILRLRAGEVMQTPYEELVPQEHRLTPVKPVLEINF